MIRDRHELGQPVAGIGYGFRKALQWAAELHQSQARKGTSIPYVGHLLIVAGTVIEWGGDENQAIAAVLHDSVEDQGREGETALEIRRRFGSDVARFVDGLSDTNETPKPPWKPRKEAYIARLRKEPTEVVMISAADKLHNARAILADLIDNGDKLWDRFSVKGEGGTPQLWYFRELLQIYEARLPTWCTRDLRAVLEELAARLGEHLEKLPEPMTEITKNTGAIESG